MLNFRNNIKLILNKIISPNLVFVDPRLLNELHSNKIQFADIGSTGGLGEEFLEISKVSEIITFDPDPRSNLVHAKNIKNFRSGLWSEQTERKLNLAYFPDASSIFYPNDNLTKYFPKIHQNHSIIGDEKIVLETIDSLIDYEIECLKIDVEGAEMEIIKGGEKALQNLLGLKIEVRFQEVFKDSPTFESVHSSLLQMGLMLNHIESNAWIREDWHPVSNDWTIWGDAYYVMSIEKFLARLKNLEDAEKKIYIIKFILILQSFGAINYLSVLIEELKNCGFNLQKYKIPTSLYKKRAAIIFFKTLIILPCLVIGWLIFLPFKKVSLKFKIQAQKYLSVLAKIIGKIAGKDILTGTQRI